MRGKKLFFAFFLIVIGSSPCFAQISAPLIQDIATATEAWARNTEAGTCMHAAIENASQLLIAGGEPKICISYAPKPGYVAKAGDSIEAAYDAHAFVQIGDQYISHGKIFDSVTELLDDFPHLKNDQNVETAIFDFVDYVTDVVKNGAYFGTEAPKTGRRLKARITTQSRYEKFLQLNAHSCPTESPANFEIVLSPKNLPKTPRLSRFAGPGVGVALSGLTAWDINNRADEFQQKTGISDEEVLLTSLAQYGLSATLLPIDLFTSPEDLRLQQLEISKLRPNRNDPLSISDEIGAVVDYFVIQPLKDAGPNGYGENSTRELFEAMAP